GLVRASGGEAPAIVAKGQRLDRVRVAAQKVAELAGGPIPDPGCLIAPARGQPAPVLMKGHAQDRSGVAREASLFPTAGQVPDNYLARLSRSEGGAIPRCQPFSIRAECHTPNHVLVAFQGGKLPTGGGVPEPYETVRAGAGQELPIRAKSEHFDVFR